MLTVTLADFRPSRRADGQFWTTARVEGADSPDSAVWQVVDTVEITPLDTLSTDPALRSFTVASDEPFLRVVFVDEVGNEDVQAVISASMYQFRPFVPEIAAILRARTYSKGEADPDEPMKAVAGAALTGEFSDSTRPTAKDVEKAIDQACADVDAAVGYVPGEKIGDARRVTALKAAAECEREYIPEQSEGRGTIYQTLRLTASEELDRLTSNLWIWTVANRGLQ